MEREIYYAQRDVYANMFFMRNHGGILVFWEPCQKHPIRCKEIKLWNILDLNVKVKTDESKIWPKMTVKCEDEMLKCDKREVILPRYDPQS